MKKQKNPKESNKNGGGPRKGRFAILNTLSGIILALIFVTGTYSLISDISGSTPEVSLSQLAQDVNQSKVAKIVVQGDDLTITYKPSLASTTPVLTTPITASLGTGTLSSTSPATLELLTKHSTKESDSSLTETLVRYGVSSEKLSLVQIDIQGPGGFVYWLAQLTPFLVPLLFIGLIIWFLTRQVKGAGVQALSFGQSKARIILPEDTKQKVTFKDVAGAKEAKQELLEIVDFLRNPKKFIEIGAQIPKGVLLMGAPGTGKTLLARAVAGEAGVAFFSISGSEFVEMFVGVGASRVRDLFKMAKEASPAIIFVDEIDAVGRVRGGGVGGGNDEREQTLNQILVEMDGFEPTEKVIVMAATNRPDVLDPALLRPGRFDRRVTIDLPDRHDREEILKIHSQKKPLAEDVNLVVIAERTPGFSGADLYSLMNEGAILAARESRVKVAQFDLIRAIEKVMLGPERKSHILSKKEKEITAYHEAGHALVSSVLMYADPVHKISIISRGRAAGYTLHLPLEDRKMQSKKEFLDDIAVSLGGYVVEKQTFGDVTTGPSNDLQVSTALARDMVTKYGMSDKLGALAFEGNGGRAMFGKGLEDKEYSEKVSADIDAEVSRIMSEAFARAEKVVTEHKAALDAIAKRLIEVETIERDEYEKIIIAHGIQPKKKLDIEHQA
ncbi:MAG: ATP-dependent metallopeptidase FtsH/Yme1/Tma family protein [Candidatus Taylorbacteria bacterium]|nr:ATP-dependent metallopeptidase FtsH/Yme1/Tma family protein [Candidatus Taylorbacteria bacterium]